MKKLIANINSYISNKNKVFQLGLAVVASNLFSGLILSLYYYPGRFAKFILLVLLFVILPYLLTEKFEQWKIVKDKKDKVGMFFILFSVETIITMVAFPSPCL